MKRFRTIISNKRDADAECASGNGPHALSTVADGKEGLKDGVYGCVNETTSNEDAQAGVKKIEAVTMAWSRTSMSTVLILYVSPGKKIVFREQLLTAHISLR